MSSRQPSSIWVLVMIVLSLVGLAVSVLWGLAIRLGYLPSSVSLIIG